MNALERYLYKMTPKGKTSTEASINTSKIITNQIFATSPSYSSIILNGITSDAIVTNDPEYEEKNILFRPDVNVDIGSVVNYQGNDYLIVNFLDNDITPKGKMKLCNTSIKVKFNETKVLLTNPDSTPKLDFEGRPRYKYESIDKDEPCIVESKGFSIDGKQLFVPDDKLLITLKYQQADNLAINKIISISEDDYRIVHIDRTTNVIGGKGLMTLTVENVADEAVID